MNVEIKNLSVDIEENIIMKNISFSVAEHQSCIIVGSYGYYNGILLNVLGGFYIPADGKVFIAGKDIYSKTEDEIVDLRKKISFVFQDGAFLSNLTVLENLLLPVKFYAKKFVKTKVMKEIKDYCEYFDVPPVLEKRPAFISYTSKKILSLIRALITHPEIIIINKPLFNLDIRNQIKVINLLKDVKKEGMTFIIASNSYDVIKSIADQVVHIEKGSIQKIMYAKNKDFLQEIKQLDILSDLVGVEDEV
ncbi:MAG: ATP-binding cassette domain-containing protein [Candidatus Celaenobacter polaris]|nr:ATP-binding cassette domain-containing protein [Candidatus Celaenobacter polaris]